MQVTAYGPRYYVDELNTKDQPEAYDLVCESLKILNDGRRKTYDAWYHHVFFPGTEKDRLKEDKDLYKICDDLNLQSYYRTMLMRDAHGMVSSQDSNHKNYIKDREDDLRSIDKKIRECNDELARMQKLKKAIVAYEKDENKQWKKPYGKCRIKIDKEGILSGPFLKEMNYHQYEYRLNERIRRMKTKIALLTESHKRVEQKLQNLKDHPPKRAVFGGKSLYKKKDTVGLTQEWKDAFHFARDHQFVMSGRADSNNGNFVMKWNESTHDLVWRLPIQKKTVTFHNFLPANYKQEYIDALKDKNASRTSMAYGVELRTDKRGRKFVLVKAMFQIPENEYVNSSLADGCIAVDLNVDHMAWSDLSADGEQLRYGVIPMKLEGLTSGQAKDVIGRSVRLLSEECISSKKPLVMEDLDAKSMKRGMKYKNKKRNRKISQFACARVLQIIEHQGQKHGYAVYKVNPRYTSFMGKVLWMRRSGTSVHIAASYMIGLRGLEKYPDVPDCYRSIVKKYPKSVEGDLKKELFCRWKALYDILKELPTHFFYRKLPTFEDKQQVRTYARAYARRKKTS